MLYGESLVQHTGRCQSDFNVQGWRRRSTWTPAARSSRGRCRGGVGHASLSTNSDAWHSKLIRGHRVSMNIHNDITHSIWCHLIFSPAKSLPMVNKPPGYETEQWVFYRTFSVRCRFQCGRGVRRISSITGIPVLKCIPPHIFGYQ